MNFKTIYKQLYIQLRRNLVRQPTYGKYIRIKGKNIFYRKKGHGPVILFIHGNLGSHRWFSDVMDISGFQVIALDLPNFGFSDYTNNFSIENYSSYIMEFIKELHLEQPILAGHSLGGAVALHTAVAHQERFKSLFLIDSSSIMGLKTPEEHYPVFEKYKIDYSLLKKALCAIMPEVKDKKRINELVGDALLMNHKAYSEHGRALESFNLSSSAKKLSIPVMFLRGAGDFLITEDMAKETISLIGGEYKVLENSGHSPQVEKPGLFIDILKDFIK